MENKRQVQHQNDLLWTEIPCCLWLCKPCSSVLCLSQQSCPSEMEAQEPASAPENRCLGLRSSCKMPYVLLRNDSFQLFQYYIHWKLVKNFLTSIDILESCILFIKFFHFYPTLKVSRLATLMNVILQFLCHSLKWTVIFRDVQEFKNKTVTFSHS